AHPGGDVMECTTTAGMRRLPRINEGIEVYNARAGGAWSYGQHRRLDPRGPRIVPAAHVSTWGPWAPRVSRKTRALIDPLRGKLAKPWRVASIKSDAKATVTTWINGAEWTVQLALRKASAVEQAIKWELLRSSRGFVGNERGES
ncbi:MAG: hypothetical protein AAGE52_41830, partial [Myxococcota bacterium]